MAFYVARITRIDGDWSSPLTVFADDLASAVARLNLQNGEKLDIRRRPDSEASPVYGRHEATEGVREHLDVAWSPN